MSPALSRLCIHTITTKPWSIKQAAAEYQTRGIRHITVWRDAMNELGPVGSRQLLKDHGLSVTSLCRGGFFPSADAHKRRAALDDNRQMIDEAHELGAPLIVLVCGAEIGLPLAEARKQIADGIAAVLPHALAAGVTLAIEPLHPMYADTRSAVNTVGQSNDIIEQLGKPSNLGIALDVYHVWWDSQLEAEIARAGRSIRAFHVCDWRSPTRDILNDRAVMGTGCIPIKQIRSWVETAGFSGAIEVEIFSTELWAKPQGQVLDEIVKAYAEHV